MFWFIAVGSTSLKLWRPGMFCTIFGPREQLQASCSRSYWSLFGLGSHCRHMICIIKKLGSRTSALTYFSLVNRREHSFNLWIIAPMPKAVCPHFMISPCLCLAVMMMVLGHFTGSGGSCLTWCSFLFKFPFWRRQTTANCLNQDVSFLSLQCQGSVWVQELRIVILFFKLRKNYSYWVVKIMCPYKTTWFSVHSSNFSNWKKFQNFCQQILHVS